MRKIKECLWIGFFLIFLAKCEQNQNDSQLIFNASLVNLVTNETIFLADTTVNIFLVFL